MKAATIDGYAGPAAVRITDRPPPRAGEGEIGIDVHAAGLNPADWKLASGWLADMLTPEFPYVLGFDAAGIVTALGAGVQGHRLGDRVVAKTAVGRGGAGGCAGHVTVMAHLASPLPDRLGFEQAAAIPTAGITAWEALFEAGRLQAGQTVLVNGGAGGTGSFAVALARDAGARIAATASAENRDYVRGMGADHVIDYRQGDAVAQALHVFEGGVDLLLDTVGQGALARPLDAIKDGGVLVTIGTLAKDEPRPCADLAGRRGIRIVTAMSNRAREGAQLKALVEAVGSGRVTLPAVEVLRLGDTAEALVRLRAGHVRGKLVVALSAEDRA